jgi:hypothetical protein
MKGKVCVAMICISGLMIGALMVAYEVGYGDMNHPIMGIIISLVMMWGAFRLINSMEEKTNGEEKHTAGR